MIPLGGRFRLRCPEDFRQRFAEGGLDGRAQLLRDEWLASLLSHAVFPCLVRANAQVQIRALALVLHALNEPLAMHRMQLEDDRRRFDGGAQQRRVRRIVLVVLSILAVFTILSVLYFAVSDVNRCQHGFLSWMIVVYVNRHA
ncbi:MAG: hypothetical protein HY552_04090 [Elusimicrobia bacterium]|nr:hypothetical protein [Elusimicrobiota bacterium]